MRQLFSVFLSARLACIVSESTLQCYPSVLLDIVSVLGSEYNTALVLWLDSGRIPSLSALCLHCVQGLVLHYCSL